MVSGDIEVLLKLVINAIQMEVIFTENTEMLKLTQLYVIFKYFWKIFYAIEIFSLKKHTRLSATF